MARIGRYKIPRPFKDEDIWFRFFTKKQLMYLLIFGGTGVLLLFVSAIAKMAIIGGILFVVFLALGIIIPRFNMPDDKYLWGGGMPLETIFLRLVLKKISKKALYIKYHNKEGKSK